MRDTGITELAGDFYTALEDGDAALCEFSFRLEKLDKIELRDFAAAAKDEAVLRLRDGATGGDSRLPPEYLMLAIHALRRAEEYLERNVGTGHVSGMICARLMGRKMEMRQ